MNISEWLETLPAYARDLKLNFSSLTQQTELNQQQIWGTVVASAAASRSPELTQVVLAETASHLSPQVVEAAKGAAAIMGMNNVYYRFLHLRLLWMYDIAKYVQQHGPEMDWSGFVGAAQRWAIDRQPTRCSNSASGRWAWCRHSTSCGLWIVAALPKMATPTLTLYNFSTSSERRKARMSRSGLSTAPPA